MPAPKLTKKHLYAEIVLLGEGARFAGGGNTKRYEGLAHDVNIEKTSFVSKNHCRCEIFGISQHDVQRITTTMAQMKWGVKNNRITIHAWEDGEAPAVVYEGDIYTAVGSYQSPDTSIQIEAMTGARAAVTPASPLARPGATSLIQLMEDLAKEAGFTFQNNDVPDEAVYDVVLNGSAYQKMYELSLQYDFEFVVDDNKVLINQWGLGLGAEHVVNARTGLVNYPQITPMGIEFRHIYKRYFRQSGVVNVESMVPYASGRWKVTRLIHSLQSEGAGRNWTTAIFGTPIGTQLGRTIK